MDTLTRLQPIKRGSHQATAWLVCLLLAAPSCGCAAYRFGARSLYRPDIRTVYVPMVESDTYRRNLGEWLAEAVVKEIEGKTPLKVVGAASADSTLRIRLVGMKKRVVAESLTELPRKIEVNMGAHVEWIDRQGRVLLAAYVVQPGQQVPAGGQSIGTVELEAIHKLAEETVNRMEVGW